VKYIITGFIGGTVVYFASVLLPETKTSFVAYVIGLITPPIINLIDLIKNKKTI
jgi:hypothetical protein